MVTQNQFEAYQQSLITSLKYAIEQIEPKKLSELLEEVEIGMIDGTPAEVLRQFFANELMFIEHEAIYNSAEEAIVG